MQLHIGIPLTVSVALSAATIVLFGFLHDYFSVMQEHLSHWASWEVGALVSTVVFTVYYIASMPLAASQWASKLALSLLLLLLPALTILDILCLAFWEHHLGNTLCVLGISLCLFGTDLVLAIKHTGDQKQHFHASVLFADVPVVIALAVLLFYQVLHLDAESPEVFFSGAVSFQLLVSNVMFVLIQTGVMKSVFRDLKDVT